MHLVTSLQNFISELIANKSFIFFFIVKASILALIVVALQTLIHIFLKRWVTKWEASPHTWNVELLKAIGRPIILLLWLLFAIFFLETAAKTFTIAASLSEFIKPMRDLSIVGCFLWAILRFINRVERLYITGVKAKRFHDPALVRAIGRLSKVSVGLMGLLLVLGNMGISVTSIAAIGGVGAAGVAFAAQGLLGNFFGGLLLYMNRAFSVGDYITSPDRNIEGLVENIGWLITTIRNPDKRPLYVPNNIFFNIIVVNVSRMTNLHLVANIALRYQDANEIPAIIHDLNTFLRGHAEVDQTKAITLNLNKFGESALNLVVDVFTKTTDYPKFFAIQSDIFLKIVEIIKQNGAQYAFPTRIVNIAHEPT